MIGSLNHYVYSVLDLYCTPVGDSRPRHLDTVW